MAYKLSFVYVYESFTMCMNTLESNYLLQMCMNTLQLCLC